MLLIALVLTYFLYNAWSMTMNTFLMNATGLDYFIINLVTIVLLFAGSISICNTIKDLFKRI